MATPDNAQFSAVPQEQVNAPEFIELGDDPVEVYCPFCERIQPTYIVYAATCCTHIYCCVVCVICAPCCVTPYFIKSCKKLKHFCKECEGYIGAKGDMIATGLKIEKI